MYKVFLVDDEIVVREGVRDNIDWDKTNFVFSGTATDGEAALPIIHEIKPDILITDIKMPFMDGLQLSNIVKRNMPWVKIIVLSGHDEFSYAKEAISIGVTEYLLKPISSSELLNVLNKIAEQISEEKKRIENLESLKKQFINNISLLRDRFLNELSHGLVSSAEAIEKSSNFNINIISKYYLVQIIEAESARKSNVQNRYSEHLKMDSLISAIIDNNSDIIKFKRNIEETVLIFKGDSVGDMEERAYALAQSIKYEVERNTGFQLTIGIGSIQERIGGIADSFEHANTAKNFKYYFGKGRIIGIKDIRFDAINAKELLSFDKANITEFLKYGVKSNIGSFLDSYLKNLKEADLKSMIYTYYAFMDIVIAASRYMEQIGGDIENIMPEINHIADFIESINSLDEYRNYTKRILEEIIDYRDSRVESKYSSIIKKAKDFIDKNYADAETSLNSVAAHVNMSPSHFSTIFSQDTGETFIEYLTKTRIRIAMDLLKNTQKKSSEIAYNVGYNDPHYFSYTFKKVTGLTPRDFRYDA